MVCLFGPIPGWMVGLWFCREDNDNDIKDSFKIKHKEQKETREDIDSNQFHFPIGPVNDPSFI
jgi:hypothetical protein